MQRVKIIVRLLILAVVVCFLAIETEYATASFDKSQMSLDAPINCLSSPHYSDLGCSPGVLEPNSSIAAAPSIEVQNQQQVAPKKVVFFGSSTTFGFGATRGDRRWTTLLSRYLGWREINEGMSGSTLTEYPRPATATWDVPSALKRWRESVAGRRPDLVVMMYGANDAYQKLPLGSVDNTNSNTYQGALKNLLSKLQSVLKPQQLIISTAQPSKATVEIRDPYDLALQEGAKKMGAFFIDTGKEAFPLSDLPKYAADGLHPNNLGHAAIASLMAGKMVDFGLAPPPPSAKGGNEVNDKLVPVSGGYLRIDLDNPLKFGEIRAIEAKWLAPGEAVLGVMRPDGRGGYNAVYRTSRFEVKPGTQPITIPRWWVLDGDLLAVWTEGDCLGAGELSTTTVSHAFLPYKGNAEIHDLLPGEAKPDFHRLAIRTVDF